MINGQWQNQIKRLNFIYKYWYPQLKIENFIIFTQINHQNYTKKFIFFSQTENSNISNP